MSNTIFLEHNVLKRLPFSYLTIPIQKNKQIQFKTQSGSVGLEKFINRIKIALSIYNISTPNINFRIEFMNRCGSVSFKEAC